MSRVYSTQFLVGAYAGTTSPAGYTVPVGKLAVVRSVDIVCAGGGPVITGWLLVSVAAISVEQIAQNTAGHRWRGDQVVNAGQQISVYTNGGTIFYMVSGFLLDTL